MYMLCQLYLWQSQVTLRNIVGTYLKQNCDVISERDKTHNNKILGFVYTSTVNHGFNKHACYLWYSGSAESSGELSNAAVYLFPRVKGVGYLTMLHSKDVPHMIKDNHLLQNQESRVVTIQQLKITNASVACEGFSVSWPCNYYVRMNYIRANDFHHTNQYRVYNGRIH